MRVNIYRQEFTYLVTLERRKAANTGLQFVGIRFWLKSHEDLHHSKADDDRSAVTFFADNVDDLRNLLETALRALDTD